MRMDLQQKIADLQEVTLCSHGCVCMMSASLSAPSSPQSAEHLSSLPGRCVFIRIICYRQ